jgi:hypothetical protein
MEDEEWMMPQENEVMEVDETETDVKSDPDEKKERKTADPDEKTNVRKTADPDEKKEMGSSIKRPRLQPIDWHVVRNMPTPAATWFSHEEANKKEWKGWVEVPTVDVPKVWVPEGTQMRLLNKKAGWFSVEAGQQNPTPEEFAVLRKILADIKSKHDAKTDIHPGELQDIELQRKLDAQERREWRKNHPSPAMLAARREEREYAQELQRQFKESMEKNRIPQRMPGEPLFGFGAAPLFPPEPHSSSSSTLDVNKDKPYQLLREEQQQQQHQQQ